MLLTTVPVLPAVNSSNGSTGHRSSSSNGYRKQLSSSAKAALGVTHHLHSCTELTEKCLHWPVEICMGYALILQPSSCNRCSKLTAHKKVSLSTNNTKTNPQNSCTSPQPPFLLCIIPKHHFSITNSQAKIQNITEGHRMRAQDSDNNLRAIMRNAVTNMK